MPPLPESYSTKNNIDRKTSEPASCDTMRFTILLLLLLIKLPVNGQALYFPPLTGTNWDTISPASLGWCTQYVDTIADFNAQRGSKAFLILKDGKIAVEQYYGTFTRDSLWYWASAGKTLTSFLTGIAQEEGYLDITRPTSDYLGTGWTSAPLAKEQLITVRNQLTMTSGLDDLTGDPYCTLPSCLQYEADAGTRWAYHNAPYTLLDTVIESATGQNFNTYFNSRIRNRIGMNGFWFPNGYNNIYGSTARSMARFGLLMLNRGIWDQDTLLHDTAYYHAMINTSQNLNKSYGYLWWLNGKQSFMLPYSQFVFGGSLSPDAPSDMYSGIGKNSQVVSVIPSQQMVIIRMGNSPDTNDVSLIYVNELWEELNKLFCSPTGIQESGARLLSLYPNPANDAVMIRGAAEDTRISVYDLEGVLLKATIGNTFSVRHFSPGIYLVSITLKDGSRSMHRLAIE